MIPLSFSRSVKRKPWKTSSRPAASRWASRARGERVDPGVGIGKPDLAPGRARPTRAEQRDQRHRAPASRRYVPPARVKRARSWHRMALRARGSRARSPLSPRRSPRRAASPPGPTDPIPRPRSTAPWPRRRRSLQKRRAAGRRGPLPRGALRGLAAHGHAGEAGAAAARGAARRSRNAALFARRAPARDCTRWPPRSCRWASRARAVEILEALAAKDPRDGETRRLLARALAADGQLEPRGAAAGRSGRAGRPATPSSRSWWRTDFLWLKKAGRGRARSSRGCCAARPIPQTRVLIGRAYRDAGEYDRARAALRAALRQDPRRAPRALLPGHGGPGRRADRPRPAREGHRGVPRGAEARARRSAGQRSARPRAPRRRSAPRRRCPPSRPRCAGSRAPLYLLPPRPRPARPRPARGSGDGARGARSSWPQEHGGSEAEIGKIHYQLGLALRKLGRGRRRPRSTSPRRGAWPARRTAGETAPNRATRPRLRSPRCRSGSGRALKRRVHGGPRPRLLQPRRAPGPGARARRPRRSGSRARPRSSSGRRRIDPDFPQLQSSLGVAYFNARMFDKATAPLSRAVAANPADADLKRLLATSWLNTEAWDKAAALLEDDPAARRRTPRSQFAYGLALLSSGRAARGGAGAGRAARRAGRFGASCWRCWPGPRARRDEDRPAGRRICAGRHLERSPRPRANDELGLLLLPRPAAPGAGAPLPRHPRGGGHHLLAPRGAREEVHRGVDERRRRPLRLRQRRAPGHLLRRLPDRGHRERPAGRAQRAVPQPGQRKVPGRDGQGGGRPSGLGRGRLHGGRGRRRLGGHLRHRRGPEQPLPQQPRRHVHRHRREGRASPAAAGRRAAASPTTTATATSTSS